MARSIRASQIHAYQISIVAAVKHNSFWYFKMYLELSFQNKKTAPSDIHICSYSLLMALIKGFPVFFNQDHNDNGW
jgi:hypothetical protein